MTGLNLHADGGSVDLTDGTTVSLRFPFRALALLEARFGSIGAVQGAIDATGTKATFGPLVQIIGAGCLGSGGFEPHFREHVDAKGNRTMQGDIVYRRRTDGADLSDLLHPGLLGRYVEAFSLALSQALASPGNAPGAAVEALVMDALTSSPGPISTTSPSDLSTSTPTASGA